MVDIEYFKRRQQLIELRYNPYHDPSNGRFTSGGGGGGGMLVVPKGQKGKGFYVAPDGLDKGEAALAGGEYEKWLKSKSKPKRKTKAELKREEYANARQYLNEWDGNTGTGSSTNRNERIDSYIQAKGQLEKYKEKVKKYGFDDEGDVRDYLTAYAKVTTAANDPHMAAVNHVTRKPVSSQDISITRDEGKYTVGLLSGGYETHSNPRLEIEIPHSVTNGDSLSKIFGEVDVKYLPHYGYQGRGSSGVLSVSDFKSRSNGRKKAEMRAEACGEDYV